MSTSGFSRRRFLTASGTMLGTGAGAVYSAGDQANTIDSGLLSIGIILGGGNHSQNMWARLINAVPDTNNIPYTPRRTGMVLTHVWSVMPEWAEEFARTFGVKNVVRNFDDMAGKVDGLIIDAFFGTPYYHHLVMPYLEARTPVYLNRPFTDSVRKAKEITAHAAQYGTPVMTGSSFEHLESTMSAKQRYPFDSITGYDAYNATSDFYSHGVHGLLFADSVPCRTSWRDRPCYASQAYPSWCVCRLPVPTVHQ